MFHAIAFAAVRPPRRSLATPLSALALVLAASAALAQQPAQRPAAQRPAAQRPAAPQQQPAQPAPQQQQAAPGQQPGQQGDQPHLIYSPWTKFCDKPPDPNAKQVCFTGRDARLETGAPVIAAALIEPEGVPKKIFRVTLPSPLQLQYGTRLTIDQNPPLQMPFFTCFANGCMADYEGTPDLITKLKQGQQLQVQAINLGGQIVTFTLPLTDFQKANEGPPVDPKVFQQQQEQERKDQEALQKKADELRKKMEQQGQTSQGTPPAR